MQSKLKRLLKIKNQKGTAAVEFVVILPVLVMILFGMVQVWYGL